MSIRWRIALLALLVAVGRGAYAGTSASPASLWTWGAALGSPQMLAVTLEHGADDALHLQGHVGSFVLVSSAGLRALLLSSREGLAPYAFIGGGVLYTAEGEGGGALGATGFGWGGLGLRLRTGGWSWFGELGLMGGMDEERGYEPWLPAVALGVGFGGARRAASHAAARNHTSPERSLRAKESR